MVIAALSSRMRHQISRHEGAHVLHSNQHETTCVVLYNAFLLLSVRQWAQAHQRYLHQLSELHRWCNQGKVLIASRSPPPPPQKDILVQNAFVPVMRMLWHYIKQQRDLEIRVLEETHKYMDRIHTESLKRKHVEPAPRYNEKMRHTE